MTWLRLDRCDGPACPHCGCQDTEIDRRRRRWGAASTRYRCRNCGTTWHPTRWTAESAEPATAEPNGNGEVSAGGAVIYRPVRCPECGSTDTKVTSTRRPVRHHKCRACGAAFKSVEREA